MAASAPKMDFKMFVMPAMLILSRQISFTVPNPEYICDGDVCPDVKVIPKEINNQDVVDKAQMGLMFVAVLLMTAYYFVYTRVNSQGTDGKKQIWVPPKPKPTLPFGMGPAPEPIKLEDFKETTLADHEADLIKEQAQSLVFPIAIAYFMSFKFNVHVSLLMQGVMLPVNSLDCMVIKKYLFGAKNNGTDDTMYGELTTKPTEADIKAINDKAKAAEPEAVADADAAPAADEPRVVELKDEPKKDAKLTQRKSSAAKDID